MKNTAARTPVVRERKFAEPVAPNRLPEAPPPKPEPMSAPLPCWSSTRPMIARAVSTCSTMRTWVNIWTSPFRSCGMQDRQKIFRHERRPADQPAIDVRHRKDRRRVLRLHAAAIQDAYVGVQLAAQKCVHRLRLFGRGVASGADGPHRFIRQHRGPEFA